MRIPKRCAEGHSPFAGCVRVPLTKKISIFFLFFSGRGKPISLDRQTKIIR